MTDDRFPQDDLEEVTWDEDGGKPLCPHCGIPAPRLLYTDRGSKVWDDEKHCYLEHPTDGDGDWRCCECDGSLEHEWLTAVGAF